MRFTSPIRAPVSPHCPLPAAALTITKGSLQSLPETKHVMLWSTRDASPSPPSSWGRDASPEPLWRPGLPWGASRERREAPAGMRSAQGSALPANAAGCRPASSHFKGCLAPRSTGGGKLCLPASCACQHVVHATHTPEGTGVPYSRPSEERVPVSPLVTEQHRQTSNHTNSHLHCLFL